MLTLPIKKKWFNMILSGEKKEEYRAVNDYYKSRLDRFLGQNIWVEFRNGYNHNAPSLIANVHVAIGYGRPEWGAEKGVAYYCLQLDYKEQDDEV